MEAACFLSRNFSHHFQRLYHSLNSYRHENLKDIVSIVLIKVYVI